MKEKMNDDSESSLDVPDDVYQMQLTQLQEQLVAVMIDNETLKSELKELKVKHKVDSLVQELDLERKRTKRLFEELQQARKSKPARDVEGEEFVDLAQEATEESDPNKEVVPPKKMSRFDTVRDYLVSGFYELVADFTEDPDEGEGLDDDKELTIKRLKENILRTKSGLHPVFKLWKTCHCMLLWNVPLSTLLIFMVYLYSVWLGWLFPLLLMLAISALTVSFLQFRGWNIDLGFFPDEKEENSEKNGDIAEKFNLVLDVAKKVQNVFGKFADSLEKIKNLLTWRHPSASCRLYIVLVFGLIMSSIMTGPNFFQMLAFYIGLKLFIIDYIYNRFPRFKHRHDATYRIWKELPTDAELEKRRRKYLIDQQIIGKRKGSFISDIDIDDSFSNSSESDLTYEDRNFCTLFDLPLSERPLPGWEGGWRATFVDKSRSFLKALSRNGRLFLTNSFLCLERHKTPSPKNIIIPLKDITHVEKAKPYGWVPGTGMAIDISVIGFEQPYTFGAILNRDECFVRLITHGTKLCLPWAVVHAGILPQKSTDKIDTTDAKPSPDKSSVEKSFRMSDLKDDLDYDDLTTIGS